MQMELLFQTPMASLYNFSSWFLVVRKVNPSVALLQTGF